ncbi:D-amino-acid transaminase, chloroplastic, partial [Cucurbita argyrosperma subsp. sororia]
MNSLQFLLKPIPQSPISGAELTAHSQRPLDKSCNSRQLSFRRFRIRCSIADTVDRISDAPVLGSSQVLERLRASRENQENQPQFLAMYSSVVGGITTDPAVMVIPIDDHMVHRGHGVFDTAAIVDGHLYELDQHLDRILRSASMAKINLPVSYDREKIKNILIRTASASKSSFYAIVIQGKPPSPPKGIKVITSSIPMKPPQFATMKSVNYLPNVLSNMEAEEKGAYTAIWLDSEGFIAEGPSMNVGFITKDKEFLMPHFDKILSGCTAKRIITLAERLVTEGRLRGIRFENLTMEEGKKAEEMVLIGSGVLVSPVLQWDEQIIGDGREGPLARAIVDLIIEDMKFGPPTVRIPIPYE